MKVENYYIQLRKERRVSAGSSEKFVDVEVVQQCDQGELVLLLMDEVERLQLENELLLRSLVRGSVAELRGGGVLVGADGGARLVKTGRRVVRLGAPLKVCDS